MSRGIQLLRAIAFGLAFAWAVYLFACTFYARWVDLLEPEGTGGTVRVGMLAIFAFVVFANMLDPSPSKPPRKTGLN